MKCTWLSLAAMIVLCTLSSYAQNDPNLEAGIKPYGSYQGTDIDTVNVMNGNVIVRIPFPANYPQRGALNDDLTLQFHAKGWHLIPLTGSTNDDWAPDRSLMGSADNLHPIHTRFISQTTVSGQTFDSILTQGLTTKDGTTHPLLDVSGDGTSLETTDGSGWHIKLSNPDQYGVPQSGVIVDRAGTQYTVSEYDPVLGQCGDASSGGFSVPPTSPQPIRGLGGNIPNGTIFNCQYAGFVSETTDSNGNSIGICDFEFESSGLLRRLFVLWILHDFLSRSKWS